MNYTDKPVVPGYPKSKTSAPPAPKPFRKKWLDCGCCSASFQTWPGYKNQDQDRGYGICPGCQVDARKRNTAEYDKMFVMIEESFSNAENVTRWQSYDRVMKTAVANKMIHDGIITWQIG